MESLLGKTRMDLIFITVTIGFLQRPLYTAANVDYRWCSYQLHMVPLSWPEASIACKERGLKLAAFNLARQHYYLTSLIKTSLPHLNPNVQQTMWMGLRKDNAGTIRYEDCKPYTAENYHPTQNIVQDCVVFNAADTTFTADDCSDSKPYLCQHTYYDLTDCYDVKTLSGGYFTTIPGVGFRPQPEECSELCGVDCMGFRHKDGECTMLAYNNKFTKVRPYIYYIKAILNSESYVLATSTVGPDVFCPDENTDIYGSEQSKELSTNYDLCTAISTSPVQSSTCYCSCGHSANENVTTEQLKENLKELKRQLSINKKDLSSWKRKLTSAPDERASAKGIGLTGVVILFTMVIALVILDLPTWIAETKRLMKRLKKCQHQNNQALKENIGHS